MIKFDIDIAGLTATLAAEEKRLAYAVATAMNRTALEIQREERAQLDLSFTIRKNEFMYRLVKITAFARVFKGIGPQQSVFAEIALDNTKARVLLAEFVEGGYKEPVSGKSVGVPITGSAARPAFTDPVSAAYQLSRIQLTQRVLKDGTAQLVSAQDGGIFSLPREAHGTVPRGLFQKVGDMTMALYLFVDRLGGHGSQRRRNRVPPHRLKAQEGLKIKSSVTCKARTKAGLKPLPLQHNHKPNIMHQQHCRTPHRSSI